MSKVDFGRINAENEDFFSRKTQKNEGAKKGDEFLFDDEFDNRHVSNNERAGGDRFDHEHHIDHEHHFNPKEDMTTKNNVDDNTITLISDSDDDTTTDDTTTEETTTDSTTSSTSLTSKLVNSLVSSTTSSTTTDDTTTEETTTDSTTSSTTSSSTDSSEGLTKLTAVVSDDDTDDATTTETAECTINGKSASYTVTKNSDGSIKEIEVYIKFLNGFDGSEYYLKVTVDGEGLGLGAPYAALKNSDGSYSETTILDGEMDDDDIDYYKSAVQSVLDYLESSGLLDEDAYENACGLLSSWYS